MPALSPRSFVAITVPPPSFGRPWPPESSDRRASLVRRRPSTGASSCERSANTCHPARMSQPAGSWPSPRSCCARTTSSRSCPTRASRTRRSNAGRRAGGPRRGHRRAVEHLAVVDGCVVDAACLETPQAGSGRLGAKHRLLRPRGRDRHRSCRFREDPRARHCHCRLDRQRGRRPRRGGGGHHRRWAARGDGGTLDLSGPTSLRSRTSRTHR